MRGERSDESLGKMLDRLTTHVGLPTNVGLNANIGVNAG